MGCRVTRTAAPGASIWPLSVSGNGRYLQTATGLPYLIHGDTPWSLAVQLNNGEIDTYLGTRSSQGFNTILWNAIEHQFSDNSPAYRNRDGFDPFTSMTNFASPNVSYWAKPDYIFARTLALGILNIVNPAYLGFGGGAEGWMSEVTAETAGDLQTYGAWIATRYIAFPNKMWCLGGDYGGDATERAKQWNIAAGIRSVDPGALITAHGARTESAYSLWGGGSYTGFNVNNMYTDGSGTEYSDGATEYARSPAMPFFLLEGRYDGAETNGTPTDMRRQYYTTMLSGGAGHMFGNVPIWDLGSASGSGGGVTNALTQLTTTATTQMTYAYALFSAYPWHLLVPKTDTSLVTTSLSSGASRICPALASDGSVAMVWKPASGSSTVSFSGMSPGSVRARFYNTTDGSYSTVSGSPFANSGTQSINWPGERVLVVDAALMAVAFATSTSAVTSFGGSSGGSLNVNPPASLAAGDLWVVCGNLDIDPGAGISVPGGWTPISSQLTGQEGWPIMRAFGKIAAGSDPAVSVSCTGTVYDFFCESIRLTGQHATNWLGKASAPPRRLARATRSMRPM